MGKALGLSDQATFLWISVRTRSEESAPTRAATGKGFEPFRSSDAFLDLCSTVSEGSAPTRETGGKGFGTFRSSEALMDLCEHCVRRVISHSVVKSFHKLEFTYYCILRCNFLLM